jgi:membrane protein implicated in regulation of membrane protease activity
MKRWLWCWTGHLLLIPLVGMAALTLIFARNTLAAVGPDAMFWNFVCAGLSLIITVIIGALSAWFWRTPSDRWYQRVLWHQDDTNASGVPLPTGPWVSPADGAHSAAEGVSTDAE